MKEIPLVGYPWLNQEIFNSTPCSGNGKSGMTIGSTALMTQVGGDHYRTLKIQPWEYIEANNLDFWEGNVVKYITRRKGSRLEDLKKAKHYLNYLIEKEEKNVTRDDYLAGLSAGCDRLGQEKRREADWC